MESPLNFVWGVQILVVDFGEVQNYKDDQDQDNNAGHDQESDTQELVGASQRIDLRKVHILFTIELIYFEYIIDYEFVCLASLKSCPYMAPQLDESWETFHLIPYHDMLICDVEPHD